MHPDYTHPEHISLRVDNFIAALARAQRPTREGARS